MLIVIGTRVPKRVRGVLQMWMLEVKPGVFVGSLTNTVESRIVKFIDSYLTTSTDLMVIRSNKSTTQGFSISYPHNADQRIVCLDGLYFRQELNKDETQLVVDRD